MDQDVRTLLRIDPPSTVEHIVGVLREQLGTALRRRGFVVAMSGGVDSSVCAALAARAVGPERVLGLFMPERDSEPQSLALARGWAETLGIPHLTEDITPTLEAFGCYARRDEAVRRVVPEFGAGWGCKVILPRERQTVGALNVSSLVVRAPDGEERTVRLPADVYRQIVAATSFKQRARKMLEYYHADRLHYAVVGTPNRLEYDQGFFVKGGDGLADVKPIAHLYKSQVYQLAEFLGVPAEIRERPPTTDTYSLPQSQNEFYFAFPPTAMDVALHAFNAGLPAADAARELACDPAHVEWSFRDIARKRASTRYLHLPPLLVEEPLDPPRPAAE